MSKLCDVKAMYGQDFGIVVTNAPSNVIESEKILPKNMIIISSENDENNNDKGMPSMFATDYNGNPLRLTYAIHNSYNGIWPNDDGQIELHIDNKSIKSDDKGTGLYVDTNNLTYCSFNNLGVTKIANSITSRTNSTYPTDTFIRVDKNGVLYLSDTFISHIYQYIASKIYLNLYPVIMDNIRGWLTDSNSSKTINYYTTDTIPVSSIEDNGIIIIKHFILNYKSISNVSEEVDFDINNNEYPIKEVILNSKTTSVVKDGQSTTEISIYKHSLDFTIKFYPNYNLQNNIFLDNQYFIKLHPQTFAENKYMIFYFNQNNVFNQNTNNVDWPIQLIAQAISLNALNVNEDLTFLFNNKFRYFEDSDFNIEIFYIKSNNENNIEDAISILNENINMQLNKPQIQVSLSSDQSSYNELKNYLFKVEHIKEDDIITQLGTASNKYKYVLKYTINGERTYTYENVFNVNYTLTNLYYAANYMTVNGINIFSAASANNNTYNENNQNFNIISQIGNQKINILTNSDNNNNDPNSDTVEVDPNHKDNITITLKSQSISTLLGNIVRIQESNKSYKDIILLEISGNFIKDIFIKNTENKYEYSIWDLYIAYDDNGNIENLEDNSTYHLHETKPEFNYTYQYEYIYPHKDTIKSNTKSLTILTAIDINELMFQNSNNDRIHSSNSNKIYYNMNIDNAHGPMIKLNIVFDYAQFFKDNIMVFDSSYINYAAPRKKLNSNRTEADLTTNDLIPIGENKNYANSKFYVGISEYLYNAISLNKDNNYEDNTGMYTNFNVYDENHNIINEKVTGVKLNNEPVKYNNTKYYLYEFEYSALFYTYDNDTDFRYDPKLTPSGFIQKIIINYKWNYLQSNIDAQINTFEYVTDFDVDSNTSDYSGLIDPQIIDE